MYIIIYVDRTAFQTDLYKYEIHWCPEVVCVVDTFYNRVTFDGKIWKRAMYYGENTLC